MTNQFSHLDFTGEKNGKWTIIGESEKTKNKKSGRKWKCQCECGAIIHCSHCYFLKNHECKNCRYEDLIGKRFGTRTVLSREPSEKRRSRRYLVKCDCGEESILNSSQIRKGYKCVNCRLNNSIGKKYGMLTITSTLLPREKHKNCIAICECGKEIKINLCEVTSGGRISCGCKRGLVKEKTINKYLGKKIGNFKVLKFLGYKKRVGYKKAVKHWFLIKCKCGRVFESCIDKFYHLETAPGCGCELRNGTHRGENAHSSKLTNQEALAIREMWESKIYTFDQLCDIFSINENILFKVIRNKTYRIESP
jgi:hypothetical protein